MGNFKLMSENKIQAGPFYLTREKSYFYDEVCVTLQTVILEMLLIINRQMVSLSTLLATL